MISDSEVSILDNEAMKSEKLIINENCIKKFNPVVNKINEILKSETSPILIGIDGMCASGKTTLGYYLKNEFDCNLFHMDDFFLGEHQRTQIRLNEIGGNVDYERFKMEVMTPILNGQNIIYRPYRCDIGKIQSGTEITYKRLNIIEGSYSQHPYFGELYHARFFMEISEKEQINRVQMRNGDEMLLKFRAEWIPKENDYFTKYHIRENSIVI